MDIDFSSATQKKSASCIERRAHLRYDNFVNEAKSTKVV